MSENSISSQQNQEEIDEYLENIKYVADKLKKYYAYKSAYESERLRTRNVKFEQDTLTKMKDVRN